MPATLCPRHPETLCPQFSPSVASFAKYRQSVTESRRIPTNPKKRQHWVLPCDARRRERTKFLRVSPILGDTISLSIAEFRQVSPENLLSFPTVGLCYLAEDVTSIHSNLCPLLFHCIITAIRYSTTLSEGGNGKEFVASHRRASREFRVRHPIVTSASKQQIEEDSRLQNFPAALTHAASGARSPRREYCSQWLFTRIFPSWYGQLCLYQGPTP